MTDEDDSAVNQAVCSVCGGSVDGGLDIGDRILCKVEKSWATVVERGNSDE